MNPLSIAVPAALLLSLSARGALGDEVQCIQGWGGGNVDGKEMRVIPADWINDGYCDCPFDGLDEPDTNACSGSSIGGWSGIAAATGSTDPNEGSLTFQCIKQTSKKIPTSNVNDGVCDCCDGSDEPANVGLCVDNCEEVMRAEIEAREKAIKEFNIGYEKRSTEIAKFQEMVEKTKIDITSMEQSLQVVKDNYSDVIKQLQSSKNELLNARLDRVSNIVSSVVASSDKLLSFLGTLSNEELVDFIIHSCQMAGEITMSADANAGKNFDSSPTCIPLRLAGIDNAYVWDDENFNNGKVHGMKYQDGDDSEKKYNEKQNKYNYAMLARISYWNSNNDMVNKVWNSKGLLDLSKKMNQRHRRLEARDDDDYPLDDDRMEEDYYPDDDHYASEYDKYQDEDEEDDYRYDRYKKDSESSSSDKPKELKGKHKELFDSIEGATFSKSRTLFTKHTDDLITRVGDLLKSLEEKAKEKEDEEEKKEGEDGEEKETEGEDEKETTEDPSATTTDQEEEEVVDPMAYRMVRTTLTKRQQIIRHGMDYAVSAKILLSSVNKDIAADDQEKEKARNDMIALAVGTIFHGQLSTTHVWQILSSVMSELRVEEGQEQQTCSAISSSCPPRIVERTLKPDNTVSISIPPQDIYFAAESYCSNMVQLLSEHGEDNVCGSSSSSSSEEGEGDNSKTETEIPTNISDFYYGYAEAKPRNDEDILNQLFAEWESSVDDSTIKSLEDEDDRLSKSQKETEKQLKKLKEEIGLSDNDDGSGNKFGPDGILYAMKDKCFDVVANKYTYEVCILGSAKQKEGSNKYGTDLGKWSGMTNNQSSTDPPEMVLSWEDGAKCWNGPKRSATVYVTCGSETRILSAEEPETCKYVLEMESYIACDDSYKAYHNL